MEIAFSVSPKHDLSDILVGRIFWQIIPCELGAHSAVTRGLRDFHDRPPDDFRDLRDDGVADRSISVCPVWNPMTCSAVSGTGYRWPRTRLHQSCQLLRSGLATPRLGKDRPPLKAVAFGVGHNPNSVPKLSETSVGSRYAVPFCIKPERGQVSENSVKPPSKECCDVLHKGKLDFPSLVKFAKNSSVIGPEAATFSIKAISASGEADILAGESAANCIDGNSIGSKASCGECSDIAVTGDTRPVFGEDALAEVLSLTERDGSHSGSFESEAEASNS